MKDRIEFYNEATTRLVAVVESSMIPPVGSKVSICLETWTVKQVTFALDYSDDPIIRRLRCNIDIEKEQP